MRAAIITAFWIVLTASAVALHGCGSNERFVYALGGLGSALLPMLVTLAILAVIAAVSAPRKRLGRTNHLTLLAALFLFAWGAAAHADERVYPARVLAVHDGDTVTADLDLGFDLTYRAVIRLHGLDAPELPTPDGLRSRDALRELLQVSCFNPLPGVRLSVVGREKYGRVLGTLYVGSTNVNAWLLQKGYARPYDGGKR